MDVTLQVLIEPATHNPSVASRYKRGSIIAVYPADRYAVLGGDGNYTMQSQMANPKFAWIHVKNAPDRNIEAVQDKLTAVSDLVTVVSHPERDVDNISTIRRRKLRFVLSQIPQAVRDQILTDREYTVEWSVVKGFIRKVIIVNPNDDSLDDESTALVDGDLDE